MHGSQLEIQRIQSKLRQIGQNHPYRPAERTESPDSLSSPSLSSPSLSFPNLTTVKPTGEAQEIPASSKSYSASQRTTADLYNSAAGRKARLAMAQVSPVLGVATQSNNTSQIPYVAPDTSPSAPLKATDKMSHQQADALAARLRQQYSGNHGVGVGAEPSGPQPGRSPHADPSILSAGYKLLERLLGRLLGKLLGKQWQRLSFQWHPRYRPLESQQVTTGKNHQDAYHAEPAVEQPSTMSAHRASQRFLLPQAVLWFAVAVVARLLMNHLLALFPSLLLLVMTIVLTPAAIALYQTAINPQQTVHSGRRLLVIMMGLLLGGQL